MDESKEKVLPENKVSARDKVMDRWNTSWKCINTAPPNLLPIINVKHEDYRQKSVTQSIDKSIQKVHKDFNNCVNNNVMDSNHNNTTNDNNSTNDDNNSTNDNNNSNNNNNLVVIKKVPKNNSLKLLAKKRKRSEPVISDTQLMVKKRVNQLRNKSLNIKIKRNRKRPLIIKNLTQSKSFMDFCTKKFPPIKEGVPFIQDRSCKEFVKDFESSNLNCCLDCYDKKNNSQTCRFFRYRTLIKNGEQLSVYAFAEEGNATHDDTKIWLPINKPKGLDQLTAKYLLIFVGQQFCKIYSEERTICDSPVFVTSVTWKKPVKGIRELCDVCETTIFNTHYVCPKCGLAVCIDCYIKRQSQSSVHLGHSSRKNHDEFGWILCNEKESHDLSAFHLAIFMTRSIFGSIDTTYHDIRNEQQIIGICQCDRLLPQLKVDMRINCMNLDLQSMYPFVPQEWLCDNRLLILKDPKCVDNLKLFQFNWLKGFPVIIENVNKSLDYELWTPNSFNLHFGKQMSRLVNCMNGSILPKRAMSDFWEGFEDIDKRLIDEKGEQLILKLKDWPPNAEFRDMLPLWFDNLMDALPLQEYTRYNGNRNLASRLPEFYVRPDLGPKMYCAYGSVLHPEKGTTNLHLDMSDAVNVMIYVGVAQKDNKPLESHLKEATNTLLMGGCDQQMVSRARTADNKVGALWHIWKAEDADKIRTFLNKVAKERNKKIESNNDPIHDQSWYLDQYLRTRLEQEYNVKGLAIVQCLGDSILVPAGAPHQVQNIHSCIKVAGEFVSPENVAHCLAMTQQFRNLSKRHNNHEDKLQVKNIIYHTIKDCLSVLLSPASNNFPVPSPPKLVSQTIDPPSQDMDVIETKECSHSINKCEENGNHSLESITESLMNNSEECVVNQSLAIDCPTKPSDVFPTFNGNLNESAVNNCNETQNYSEIELQIESSKQKSNCELSSPPSLSIGPIESSTEESSISNLLSSPELLRPPVLRPYSYETQTPILNS